jgi:phosphomevalonate kinase
MSEFKAFSAPGKALLAGGYLVLDPAFDAYVVALSARMHSVIRSVEVQQPGYSKIVVKSPQFDEAEWEYQISEHNGAFEITELQNRNNPFVLSTIETILYYIYPTALNFQLEIYIFSDPGYHSTSNTVIKSFSKSSKTFRYHTQKITEVAKTGLGSSAGLVTVLTTALLSYFQSDFNLNSTLTMRRVHNLAQVAHCHAQGKVGSGFDVAAATFGSIVYKRFEPVLISALPEGKDLKYHDELVKLVDFTNWKIRNDQVTLPKGVKLIMGDVKTGSNTPQLVSKVLKWRSEDPESGKIYNDLNNANISLVEQLDQLNKLVDESSYSESLNFITNNSADEILQKNEAVLPQFSKLINSILKIRENLRDITFRSGAEIEPVQQTALLNACSRVPGVLGGVVPGAGGYDAICLLVAENAVDQLKSRSLEDVAFKGVEWLELSEESNGVQTEPIEIYLELIH